METIRYLSQGKIYESRPSIPADVCRGCAAEKSSSLCQELFPSCNGVIFVEVGGPLPTTPIERPAATERNLCLKHNELYPADGGGCSCCEFETQAHAVEFFNASMAANPPQIGPVKVTDRHPLDVASDPEGLLIHKPGEPLLAAGSKPTNPKDAIATNKLPLHLVSPIVKAYQAIAHFLGNVKYGAWNWRPAGVRASVYKSALERHLDAWWEGEKYDPTDGTPHLANAQACLNILIEAEETGVLTDDRPPSRAEMLARVRKELEALMPKIRERYAHMRPVDHTIAGEVPR